MREKGRWHETWAYQLVEKDCTASWLFGTTCTSPHCLMNGITSEGVLGGFKVRPR